MRSRLPQAERRAQLVAAALDIAVGEGVAATTIRRVAERAGVALGVVHYCFEDKDDLFVALAERIVTDLLAAASGARGFDDAEDLAAALQCALDGLWEGIEATRDAQLLTYEITTAALRNPALNHVAVRQYEVSRAAVGSLLSLAATSTNSTWLHPVDELADEMLAMLDGVTLRWLVDGDSTAARDRLARFTDYLRGYAKTTRRRRKASA
ncbi:TetR/AcrR family transcriptional regulator [Mycobacterium sp. pUA109]|uniref:TetR/AcrR family transcriptional regulator n=1 Tax=Mycobacterium sp. pUA109 TaxID=3238982 RepID=UPI00351B685F